MLTFVYVAQKAGFVVDSYEDDAVGVMTKSERGATPWVSQVTLTPEDRLRRREAAHRRRGGASPPRGARAVLHRELGEDRDQREAMSTTRTAEQERLNVTWDEHVKGRVRHPRYRSDVETMVADAYVNHIPVLTGGVGRDQLREFYSRQFIPQMPPDTADGPRLAHRRRRSGGGRDGFGFTHTIEMDWMLPGVAPPASASGSRWSSIVHFRGDKLAHEHIYWDQASVLAQLGLIDASAAGGRGRERGESD